MKRIFFTSGFSVLVLASSCATVSPSGRVPATSVPVSYRLVWSDDFHGTELDATKWIPLIRRRGDAFDDPASVLVSDGLKIVTHGQGTDIRTGFLSTQGLFETTFGYFEARIRFHDSPGEWCAFWLQSPTNGKPVGDPANAGVEIDVAEHRARDAKEHDIAGQAAVGALHWDGYGASLKNDDSVMASPRDGQGAQGSFHDYGVLWDPSGYRFYLDGVLVSERHPGPGGSPPVSRAKEFLHLSCEVHGGSWAGAIPQAGYGGLDTSETGMDVAWVRVWQGS